MTAPGDVYLIGSASPSVMREVWKRVRDAVKEPRPTVAVSFAALPSAGEGAMQRFVLAHLPWGRGERFFVAGEPGFHDPAEARRVVERSSVVFLMGGDPVLCAERLVAAGADVWLRDAVARGAVCVGLSAGSIALGAFWASWPEDDPHGPPALVRCTDVARGIVVDCHAESDGWEELHEVKKLALDRADGGSLRFAGIPSGGALCVRASGETVAIGTPPVWL